MVECDLPKVEVASSNLVARSKPSGCVGICAVQLVQVRLAFPAYRGHYRLGIQLGDRNEPLAVDAIKIATNKTVLGGVRNLDSQGRQLFARHPEETKWWVKAEVSSHIWTALLPADLRAGAHRVTVEATTEYGDVVKGGLALEVAG